MFFKCSSRNGRGIGCTSRDTEFAVWRSVVTQVGFQEINLDKTVVEDDIRTCVGVSGFERRAVLDSRLAFGGLERQVHNRSEATKEFVDAIDIAGFRGNLVDDDTCVIGHCLAIRHAIVHSTATHTSASSATSKYRHKPGHWCRESLGETDCR